MLSCYLQSDLYTEELAVEFGLYAITPSQYTLITEIWTALFGDGVI